jgi:hypothetical protein
MKLNVPGKPGVPVFWTIVSARATEEPSPIIEANKIILADIGSLQVK